MKRTKIVFMIAIVFLVASFYGFSKYYGFRPNRFSYLNPVPGEYKENIIAKELDLRNAARDAIAIFKIANSKEELENMKIHIEEDLESRMSRWIFDKHWPRIRKTIILPAFQTEVKTRFRLK